MHWFFYLMAWGNRIERSNCKIGGRCFFMGAGYHNLGYQRLSLLIEDQTLKVDLCPMWQNTSGTTAYHRMMNGEEKCMHWKSLFFRKCSYNGSRHWGIAWGPSNYSSWHAKCFEGEYGIIPLWNGLWNDYMSGQRIFSEFQWGSRASQFNVLFKNCNQKYMPCSWLQA